VGRASRDRVREFRETSGLPTYYEATDPWRSVREQHEAQLRFVRDRVSLNEWFIGWHVMVVAENRTRGLGRLPMGGVPMIALGEDRRRAPPIPSNGEGGGGGPSAGDPTEEISEAGRP
jgi:hypothetical protein